MSHLEDEIKDEEKGHEHYEKLARKDRKNRALFKKMAEDEEEQNLDSMIDDLEEEYGISMDEDTQKGFFTLLEKLSPKDRNGNVIEYADHHAVWEEYQVRRERMAGNSNRARDLASRSVVRSGASPSTSVEADSNERWLRENGII